MIKNIFLYINLIYFGLSAQTSFNYTINGILTNTKQNSTTLYIHHKWDNKNVTDSFKVKAGKFSIKGKSNDVNMYWITKGNDINEQPNLVFFVDAGITNITGSIDSLNFSKVSGGSTQKDYLEYNALMSSFGQKQQNIVNAYNEARAKGDNNLLNQSIADYQAIEKEVKTALEDFVKNHSKSPVSGYAIYYAFQNPNTPVEDLERIVSLLDKSTENTKYGKLGRERLNQIRGSMIGYEATNFAQADPTGKIINLKDLKGQFVLVDFWASWCGPCRAENPNVVRAYNKYKDKGFTVLGVSFDQNKEAWIKAIEKDNLTWTQISDLKGWGNEAGKLYGITSIPQNLLLNKEGKIVAKNLRGAELESKLEEIIK